MTVLLVTTLEVYLGLTLVGAAIQKWGDDSPLLPALARRWPALAASVTDAVVWSEVAVGVALLLGVEPVVSLAGAALFGSFLAYKGYLVIRQGREARCGCRGGRRSIGPPEVVVGAVQFVLALTLVLLQGGEPSPVRIGFGVVVLLVYIALVIRRRRVGRRDPLAQPAGQRLPSAGTVSSMK